MTAQLLIEKYELQPHPEGGFFRQTYLADEVIKKDQLPPRFCGDRHVSTAIYFLLTKENFSAFHRIKSDELWHFYAGGSLLIHIIDKKGVYSIVRLGSNIAEGETFQAVVNAGCWFASQCAPGTSFSFVGCTVSPGFDYADFELAKRADLSLLFPAHKMIIEQLTRQ